jgi:hypothetical protein
MLGANVGTTLIVQVLAFDVSRVSFLLILIGVFMFRRSGVTRTRDPKVAASPPQRAVSVSQRQRSATKFRPWKTHSVCAS